MKILLISDREEPYLWDYYKPGRLSDYDLILAAGDLKAAYLEFLVTMANKPLIYVHGNHDGRYESRPPEGCECADDKLLTVNGLRILGLGGSGWYGGGVYQYTERQMQRRIRRLRWKIRRAGGVDIILTHAPARGYGDDDSPAHRGFEAFLPLIDRLQPRYFIHGHVHLNYSNRSCRVYHRGETTIINAFGRCVIDTEQEAELSETMKKPTV